jgi:hypothetical protein
MMLPVLVTTGTSAAVIVSPEPVNVENWNNAYGVMLVAGETFCESRF